MNTIADRKSLDRKFTWRLLVLSLIGLMAVGATWHASKYFAHHTLLSEHERLAASWKLQIITLLDAGYRTFIRRSVSEDDVRILRQLTYSTKLYRITLIDNSGKPFWSTSSNVNTAAVDSEAFSAVRNGKSQMLHDLLLAAEIDGMEPQFMSGQASPDEERSVVSALIPIKVGREFDGAMSLHFDTTELAAIHETNIKRATLLLCAVFVLLSFVAAWFSFRHNRQRLSDIAALVEAHEKALAAEADARSMASELQQVNEDVVRLNKDLDRNLKELHQAQEEIIRKGRMAQLGQLTATIAHDIRNPLGVVRSTNFLIERKLKGTNPELEKPLQRINRAIIRCDDIITELLDFARTSEINTELLSVDSWLKHNVTEQSERLPEMLHIECHLGLGDTHASFDPGSMQRVLVNLLTNASEAMVGKAGDSASVTTDQPTIIVSSRRTERGIELHVTDNGPGMSEEVQAKVLEPLYTTKNFGVGLGLPAVEKVLQRHGGGLEIRSSEGAGTTMIAWFPLTQDSVAADEDNGGRHLQGSFLAAG